MQIAPGISAQEWWHLELDDSSGQDWYTAVKILGARIRDRNKFHESLKAEFMAYLEELRNPQQTDLRRRFRLKMDFISRKPTVSLPSSGERP